ncbi:hypothetical protein [Paremcibacter congregatus]|uniref:hypothetical protein n=1 Tax=Paremcibacter congregatus TaxID=2043170 RepID=UPI003A93DC1D
MAGRLGVDPAPLDIRELTWMFEAAHGTHDAALRSIVAAIINTVAAKPVKPSDLVYEDAGGEEEAMTEEQSKALFVMMGVCTNG